MPEGVDGPQSVAMLGLSGREQQIAGRLLMRRFFINLFYPWISAAWWAGYMLYSTSDGYARMLSWMGKEACVSHFINHSGNEWIDEAIKKHWLRILFMPWTFHYHVDFDGEEL